MGKKQEERKNHSMMENLKHQLNDLIEDKGSKMTKEMLKISQQLDNLIMEDMNRYNDLNK